METFDASASSPIRAVFQIRGQAEFLYEGVLGRVPESFKTKDSRLLTAYADRAAQEKLMDK